MPSSYLTRDEEIRTIARGLREVSDEQLAFAAKEASPSSDAGRAISYEQQRRKAFPASTAPGRRVA